MFANEQGFSLVEMLISMLIFSMVSTILMQTYFYIFQSKTETRSIQQDVESARYGMESMVKTLRMSSIFTPITTGSATDYILAYDYSQGKCLEYRLKNHVLEVGVGKPTCMKNDKPGGDQKVWVSGCNHPSSSSFSPVTTASVAQLNFSGAPSSNSGPKLGYVTIGFQICYNNDCSINDAATMQSSVSLRDYSFIGEDPSKASSSTESPCN